MLCSVCFGQDEGEKNSNYQVAAALLRTKNFDAAETLLEKAREECPESIAVLSASAYCAKQQDKDDEELNYYKLILKASINIEKPNDIERVRIEKAAETVEKEDEVSYILYKHAKELKNQSNIKKGNDAKLLDKMSSLLITNIQYNKTEEINKIQVILENNNVNATVGKLHTGALIGNNRTYTFTSVPNELNNVNFLRMECKTKTNYEYIVNKKSTILLIVDKIIHKESQLSIDKWQLTNIKLESSVSNDFVVYRKTHEKGRYKITSIGNWPFMIATRTEIKIN